MKFFSKAIVLAAVIAVLVYSWFNTYLARPLVVDQGNKGIIVNSGMSYRGLVDKLSNQGVIDHPEILTAYIRLTGQPDIHAGEYSLSADDNILTLLTKMQKGEVLYHRITIPEGYSSRQMLEKIQSDPLILSTITYDDLPSVISKLGYGEHDNVEGLFFPDSYSFTRMERDVDLLSRMAQRLNKVLAKAWVERDKDLPYKSSYEALIMASIVEKETGAQGERMKVAGVFVRRLDKGMRLQTDPTVIYGMGEAYQGKITRTDLKIDTPYNTYTRSGLPPTPISMVGQKAIEAALHPAAGNSLYFVAKGDGSHQFSATLEAHNRAVTEYQLKRRIDYRSHPEK